MLRLKVNGVERTFDGDSQMPLLWYLRDILGLTGTKYGCGMALCGSCTVHQNGKAVRACVVPMSKAAGSEIRTIEGLSSDGSHPVQKAWMKINVPQRNLPADSSSDQRSSGRTGMNEITNVSRRGFLQGVFSAGALVLSVKLV